MHVMKHVNTEYQNEKLSLSENKIIILEYLILSMHIKTWTAVLKISLRCAVPTAWRFLFKSIPSDSDTLIQQEELITEIKSYSSL